MDTARVVVTGMGIVSPAGIGHEPLWNAVVEGRSCLFHATELEGTFARYGFSLSEYDGYVGALRLEVIDEYLTLNGIELDETEMFLVQPLIAAREALREADLKEDGDLSCVGLSLGSNFGQLGILEALHRQKEQGLRDLSPKGLAAYPFHGTTRFLADRFGMNGPRLVFSVACASSNFALGHAFDLIRSGRSRRMLAGGWEGLQASGLIGAFRLGVIDTQPCRPFDKERMGFTPGYGAAFLVLESLEAARARGVEPVAEIAGFGASCDAYHITSPDPDGHGMALAMERAIGNARLNPSDIDYINAHGTATYINDKIETIAIKKLFGDRAGSIPVSSTKSVVGHTAGASAALEAAVCCLAVRKGVIPPTIHYSTPDPECDLDYVPNHSRLGSLSTALNNSFAFGGNNSSLVVRRFAP